MNIHLGFIYKANIYIYIHIHIHIYIYIWERARVLCRDIRDTTSCSYEPQDNSDIDLQKERRGDVKIKKRQIKDKQKIKRFREKQRKRERRTSISARHLSTSFSTSVGGLPSAFTIRCRDAIFWV